MATARQDGTIETVPRSRLFTRPRRAYFRIITTIPKLHARRVFIEDIALCCLSQAISASRAVSNEVWC